MSGGWILMSDRKTTPTSKRNISSPFSLAIPQKSQRRTTYHRAGTPTKYLNPPEEAIKLKGTPYLEIPKAASPRIEYSRPYARKQSQIRYNSPYTPKKWQEDEPKSRLNDRVLALAVTFALAVLLAIGIPLAVILPQKYIKLLPINVLVPFYLNPEVGSWNRLEDAIVKHHDTRFTVVVNPNDGLGNATWPSATFIDAVKQINIYPNVQIVGYINVANGTMANATVRTEMATYAGWGNVTKGLALDGIYFDQAPRKGDEQGLIKAYMQNVSTAVRKADGWSSNREGLVVYNSGRLPDMGLMDTKPEITVVFEGAYSDMPEEKTLSTQLAAAKGGRESYAMLVNLTPGDLRRGGLRRIVGRVRRDVEWLYVTDLMDNVNTMYGSFWEEWLDLIW